MGDRDYRQVIKNAIEGISKDVEPKINLDDYKTIHVHEVVRCLRRSYFDRVEPLDPERTSFSHLISGLLQKVQYGSILGEFSLEKLTLKGQADIIVDDVVMIFRNVVELPDSPYPPDALYLNACLWIFKKSEGIIVYLTNSGGESSYSITKNTKMFEELARRVRVLNDLLEEKKVPILEPSNECMKCQYYERCYFKKKTGKGFTLPGLFGMKET